MSAGWVIGFTVGGVVVVVVVALLLLMIVGVRETATRAEAILGALHAGRDNTQGLWEVERTNLAVTRILVAATTIRRALAGETTGTEEAEHSEDAVDS